MSDKPAGGSDQEAGGGAGLLIWQQLGVGQAAVVVHAHVQVFPARAPLALGAVTGDGVAHALDAPRFFMSMCTRSPGAARS